MKFNNFLSKYYKYIIAIICILSLIPFFIVSIYSRPCVDDFTYSVTNHHLINSGSWNIIDLLISAIKVDIYKYNTWQGLYTSAFVLSLQPGIFGEKYYFIGSILLMIIIYICLLRLIHVLNKYYFKSKYPSWLITLVLYTVLLQGLPNICQGLYWFNGAWNYTPFFFLVLVVVSYIVDYFNISDLKKKRKDLIIASILSFVISGGNHITSVLNIMVLGLICLHTIINKKDKKVFVVLLVALIGFAIMYFAPGTAIRQSVCEKSSLVQAIINSTLQVYKCICKWVDIKWLLLCIMTIIVFTPFISSFNGKLKLHPLLMIMLSILILIGMYFPPYYAMSDHGDLRIYNIIWLAFYVLSFINIVYLFLYLRVNNKLTFNINIKNIISYSFLLFIVLYMCFIDNNFDLIQNEFSQNLPQSFASTFDERIELAKTSNDDIIEVESLPDSKVLKFDDINDDISSNRNISWENYYGKGIKLIIK